MFTVVLDGGGTPGLISPDSSVQGLYVCVCTGGRHRVRDLHSPVHYQTVLLVLSLGPIISRRASLDNSTQPCSLVQIDQPTQPTHSHSRNVSTCNSCLC